MAELDQEGEAIGALIIGNLDKDGYLRAEVAEIAGELGVEPARVEEVLAVVQGFDPPGVAARDLKECLQLQVRLLGTSDPLVSAIIDGHLNNLANKNYQAIARELKVSLEKESGPPKSSCSWNPNPAGASTARMSTTSTPTSTWKRWAATTSSA